MAGEPQRKNRSAVLLEDIQSEVHKIAEGHETLARGISSLENRFSGVEQRFTLLEQALTRNNVRLERTSGQLGELLMRFDTHEQTHRR